MAREAAEQPREHIHFVTGRLAEFSLKNLLEHLAAQLGFDYSVEVMPITVAALMTPEWIARRLQVPPKTDRVLLPGYCEGDLSPAGVGLPHTSRALVSGIPAHSGRRERRSVCYIPIKGKRTSIQMGRPYIR